MAEATTDPAKADEAAELKELAAQLDRARMIQIGSFHFAMLMGVITLWGAAETWLQVTGWGIARFASVGTALVAAFVLTSVVHEWGHFAGARRSGAVSPVLEEVRRHFFMFDFAMDRNDTRQFVWMSWGGILAPWLVILLVVLFVPLGTLGAQVLLATLLARAVSIAVFEAPIALAAADGGDPGAELGKAVAGGGLAHGRKVGTAVGVGFFLLLWLAA
ncbi:MAG: hypothetical protein HKP30_15130 [Myxococcales bacterium]|nr:hypothetical protein [Myxococcales bacterium]